MSHIVRVAGGVAIAGVGALGVNVLSIPLAPVVITVGLIGGTVVLVSYIKRAIGSNPNPQEIKKLQTTKGGDKFYLQSQAGDYCSAELNSDCRLMGNKTGVQESGRFQIMKADDGRFAFQASNQRFLSADQNKGGLLIADRNEIGDWELFTMEDRGNSFVALKASNGKYVSKAQDGSALLKATSTNVGASELFRTMIEQDQIALKDPISITETIVIKKTISVVIDILECKEAIKHRYGNIRGTIINLVCSKKWLKKVIATMVMKELSENLKISIEQQIDAALSSRLSEEVSQRITEKLASEEIIATVITEMT